MLIGEESSSPTITMIKTGEEMVKIRTEKKPKPSGKERKYDDQTRRYLLR